MKSIKNLAIRLILLSIAVAHIAKAEPVMRIHTVHGYSMYPAISSGDTVCVDRAFRFERLQKNDIVLRYDRKNGYVLHRVMYSYSEGKWITKGDNNRFRDRGFLTKHNYLGKLKHILT
jgi:signal peptidase I